VILIVIMGYLVGVGVSAGVERRTRHAEPGAREEDRDRGSQRVLDPTLP